MLVDSKICDNAIDLAENMIERFNSVSNYSTKDEDKQVNELRKKVNSFSLFKDFSEDVPLNKSLLIVDSVGNWQISSIVNINGVMFIIDDYNNKIRICSDTFFDKKWLLLNDLIYNEILFFEGISKINDESCQIIVNKHKLLFHFSIKKQTICLKNIDDKPCYFDSVILYGIYNDILNPNLYKEFIDYIKKRKNLIMNKF